MNDNNIAPSFDRMRNMLVRAAEVRESEQQQIFDALDDIYAKLSPVESLGSIRKRLSELPDRTEVGVLAERLDEAMSRIETTDAAVAAVARAVDAIVDKLAKPFAELGGRLDGVAGKFEGVAGRMDGLEDKLQNIHRRLDELDVHLDKQDSRLESIPGSVHRSVVERIETAETSLTEQLAATDADSKQRIDDATATLNVTDQVADITDKLEQLTTTVDELSGRLGTVEENISARVGDLDGAVNAKLTGVEGVIQQRPDADALIALVQKSNTESEQRIGGQLDEAMATFAELMLGGGPASQPVQQTPPPRQPRRSRSGSRSRAKKEDEAPAES